MQLIQLLEIQGAPRLLCHKGTILPATKTHLSTTLNISLCINLESQLRELSLQGLRAPWHCSSSWALGTGPECSQQPRPGPQPSSEPYTCDYPIMSYSLCLINQLKCSQHQLHFCLFSNFMGLPEVVLRSKMSSVPIIC